MFQGFKTNQRIRKLSRRLQEQHEKRKALREVDLFVLDNSLRESTVGQLRGHTLENKWKIYNEIKKVGFQEIIVASFSHMTRLGDTFLRDLAEKGEDFSKLWAFSEAVESVDKDKVPDPTAIPIGLRKMKELGVKNAIIETDFVYHGIDYEKFTIQRHCELLCGHLEWSRNNLGEDARVVFNLRDFPDTMRDHPERLLNVVAYLSSLPPKERPFGFVYEEPYGHFLPEELGEWTATLRETMDDCGFKNGHLLVHVHQQWGLADMSQLECIVNGANGIWAGLAVNGSSMGHSCSAVTLMNLIRMGNTRVLEKYNCMALRQAAQNVCRITTGAEPYDRTVVYGARALDLVFGIPPATLAKKEFNMAEFFGQKPVMRMTTLASPAMIVEHLKSHFGDDPQFTEERGQRMKEMMLEDLQKGRKEEYMSKVGVALLFDRSGGQLTKEMAEAVEEDKPKSVHAQELIAEIRETWNEWDLRDADQGDDKLEFNSFYNGFMAPYFGNYRCENTKRALQAIDMDDDGQVDWNEFALYLKWAIRQYPETKTAEDLLSITFLKGLIPAMQDIVLN